MLHVDILEYVGMVVCALARGKERLTLSRKEKEV